MGRTRRVFSESFKREKVKLLERGKMSVSQLSELYNISETALYKWKKEYGIFPPEERIVGETDSDYLHMLRLSNQVEEMERLIGMQQIKLEYFKTGMQQAAVHYGEDIEKKSLVECGRPFKKFGQRLLYGSMISRSLYSMD